MREISVGQGGKVPGTQSSKRPQKNPTVSSTGLPVVVTFITVPLH